MANEESKFLKKSVSLHGHKTRISLEKIFWFVLEGLADSEGVSLNRLIQQVDENRQGNLASALRLYVLEEVLKKSNLLKPSLKYPSGHGQGKEGN